MCIIIFVGFIKCCESQGGGGIFGPTDSRGGMIFLIKKIEGALVWTVRCKGCGEYYVTREVGPGEVTYTDGHQAILCHKTKIPYQYDGNEFENIWAP
jgi:hypothetical protein